ncbi:MAG: FecR family protein [Mangrovibacterium sp.]
MKNTEDIWQIVSEERSKSEREDFFSELEQDRQAREKYRKVKNIYTLFFSRKQLPEDKIEKIYQGIKKRIEFKEKKFDFRFSSLIKYAAVLIGISLVVSTLLFYFKKPVIPDKAQEKRITTVVAENGQISKVILSDSSVLWLNSGTNISFDKNFALSNREVMLSGQAFFDVKRNEKIPFQVVCPDLRIRVLGTRFDVSAYPDDKKINVFLESGKVEMLNSREKTFRHELSPGDRVQYNKKTGNLVTTRESSENFTRWKSGILVFRDDPMYEVIPRLQRRYDIEIEVKQPVIYQSVFTATIKNESIEEIFELIGYACEVNYTITGGNEPNSRTKVTLTSKN